MQIPNGWKPSSATKNVGYDQEGRMRLTRYGHGEDGGVGDANSIYATEAERFDVMAPFLRRNRDRDARRRNYVVQPGGAILFGGYPSDKPRFDGPTHNESFGHNSMDGSKLATAHGNGFTTKGSNDE